MHEEASYEGLDPIECEIRRRVFWLLFDGELWPQFIYPLYALPQVLRLPLLIRC